MIISTAHFVRSKETSTHVLKLVRNTCSRLKTNFLSDLVIVIDCGFVSISLPSLTEQVNESLGCHHQVISFLVL